jgi:hypothetical protein
VTHIADDWNIQLLEGRLFKKRIGMNYEDIKRVMNITCIFMVHRANIQNDILRVFIK